MTTAPDILTAARDAIADRAAVRDAAGTGERSMARTVTAFNAITGQDLCERDGWLFMAMLKAARAQHGRHHGDDYIDGAAYFALAGEVAAKDDTTRQAFQPHPVAPRIDIEHIEVSTGTAFHADLSYGGTAG